MGERPNMPRMDFWPQDDLLMQRGESLARPEAQNGATSCVDVQSV